VYSPRESDGARQSDGQNDGSTACRTILEKLGRKLEIIRKGTRKNCRKSLKWLDEDDGDNGTRLLIGPVRSGKICQSISCLP